MSNCRPEFQNEAVLLVEDNPTNQFAVFQMLEAAKLNVDIASNGSIALRVLERREDFRLVLMDVEMPVMDGLRASREIRTIWPDRELPIIGLTANSGPAELQACLDAGMSEVLTKPVRRQDLLATLARWLGTSKDMADGPIHSDAMVLDRPDLPGIKVKEAMTRLGSPWEMLRDMLLQLGDSLPQRLVNLEQAIQKRDLNAARFQAHSISGAAGSAGAMRVRESARQLEAAIKQGEGDLEILLARLRANLEIMLESIRSIESEGGAITPAIDARGRSSCSGRCR